MTSPQPSLATGLGVGAVGAVVTVVISLLVLQLATFRRRALARGRVVAAGDRDRQSLERDLHDGAQQRLLSVSLVLERVYATILDRTEAATLVVAAREELARSLQELRELAHGLHPAVLSDHGLEVAVKGVVARMPVPVDVCVEVHRRLPLAVEAAAYYVVCEALANSVKHARATATRVSVVVAGRYLWVEVRDNGVGGARVGGSGLRGLADRIEALDGRFTVSSPQAEGTWIRARIPLG